MNLYLYNWKRTVTYFIILVLGIYATFSLHNCLKTSCTFSSATLCCMLSYFVSHLCNNSGSWNFRAEDCTVQVCSEHCNNQWVIDSIENDAEWFRMLFSLLLESRRQQVFFSSVTTVATAKDLSSLLHFISIWYKVCIYWCMEM